MNLGVNPALTHVSRKTQGQLLSLSDVVSLFIEVAKITLIIQDYDEHSAKSSG